MKVGSGRKQLDAQSYMLFKQAGYQPDVSDLEYLRLEQGLGENLPDYLAAELMHFLTQT